MPTFDTPKPISADVDFAIGNLRVVAGDREDTVVEVTPSDPTVDADVKAADRAKINYVDGRLTVSVPKQYRPTAGSASVDVRIELPAESSLSGTVHMAAVHAEGRLGDCRVKNGVGDVRLEWTGPLRLDVGKGEVSVTRVDGPADVLGGGLTRIGEIHGTATVRNTNGDVRLGFVRDTLKVNAATGAAYIGEVRSDTQIKAANGKIVVAEAVRGTMVLEAGAGDVEVGIRLGTAAHLDLRAKRGTVRNELALAAGPGNATEVLNVRARTSTGDIVVHRS